MANKSFIIGYAKDAKQPQIRLELQLANRHGLIAGATGTGKTVTLQAFAESFSRQGVPVFLSDVKGDISGISQAGKPHPKVNHRFKLLGLPEDAWAAVPTIFWDVLVNKDIRSGQLFQIWSRYLLPSCLI
jgi:hypothetical protein